MRSRLAVILMTLGLLLGLTATPVAAAGLTVNSLADTAPADDGSCTLREAITAANTDTASGALPGECAAGAGADIITFSVSGTITLGSALPAISTDVTIAGAGSVTVSGASAFRVFEVTGGTVTLSGLTITGGSASNGAGILVSAGTLNVTNSTISGNTALGEGGGIFTFGTVNVTNSTITANAATLSSGGGIRNGIGAGTLTVTDSTISENSAGLAGGGILSVSTLIVTDSTISENFADSGGGGGLWVFGSTSVTGSTISGNSTDFAGAGIWIEGGTTSLANATVSGNTALFGSGGIRSNGTVALTNLTISGNTATSGGSFGGGLVAAGTETVVNSIIAGNNAPSDPDVLLPIETSTTNVIGVPGGQTLADILVPAGLANNGGPTETIALAQVAGNPAIDTGTSAVCAAAPVNGVDQRGLPRPAACDIGAFEIQVAAEPLPDAAMAQPAPVGPWIALGSGMLIISSLGVLAAANLGVVRRRR